MSRQPSDTLLVNVTELRFPVDEKVMRDVFSSIATVNRVQLLPQTVPTMSSALVQFSDARGAHTAMNQRQGRHIYADCNKMEISFAAPEPAPIFAQPPQQPPLAPMANQMPQGGMQQQAWGMQQPVAQNWGMQQGGMMPPVQVGMGGPMQGGMMGGPMQGGMMGPGMQGGMMGPGMQQQWGMFPGQNMGYGPNMGYGGGPGMGRGRGGMGGPGMGPGGMNMGGQMMNPYGNNGGDQGTAPFVSINEVPAEATLKQIFNFLEVWGQVATIRRTQRQGIVHIRMDSVEDAENVARFVHKTPFMGAEISARSLPTFVERSEIRCEGEGPDEPSSTQWDFRGPSIRHRPRGQRSRCCASNTLRLHLKRTPRSEDEVKDYFLSIGFPLVIVERDTNNNRGDDILVKFDSAADASKALLACHGHACGVEGGQASFVSTYNKRKDDITQQ